MLKNVAAITLLLGALLLAQSDEWVVLRACYTSPKTTAPLSDETIVSLPEIGG